MRNLQLGTKLNVFCSQNSTRSCGIPTKVSRIDTLTTLALSIGLGCVEASSESCHQSLQLVAPIAEHCSPLSFWVKDHRQIYLIGNPIIWWLSSLSILAFAGVRVLLILRAKRSYQDFTNCKSHFASSQRNHADAYGAAATVVFYDRVCTFFAAGWALHYFPFFIMGRQLFLHHYFPALYFSILMLGAVFDLATSKMKPKTRLQVAGVILLLSLWSWQHWAPLAYAGQWTKKDCHSAQWLKTWDFSCNSFPKAVRRLVSYFTHYAANVLSIVLVLCTQARRRCQPLNNTGRITYSNNSCTSHRAGTKYVPREDGGKEAGYNRSRPPW